MRRKFWPQNPLMIEQAKELRQNQSEEENIVWYWLRNHRFKVQVKFPR